MTDLSPSTLAAIAERLPGVDMIERREGRYAVWFKGGKWDAWSAWDLIGAMLERAAEMGADRRSTRSGKHSAHEFEFNGKCYLGMGEDELASTSAAFIRLPKVAT